MRCPCSSAASAADALLSAPSALLTRPTRHSRITPSSSSSHRSSSTSTPSSRSVVLSHSPVTLSRSAAAFSARGSFFESPSISHTPSSPLLSPGLPFERTSSPSSSLNRESPIFPRSWSLLTHLAQAAAATAPPLAMAAASEPAEVLVKAATGQPDKLGDCPFSQRVLLTLEEKGIPYSKRLVDTSNKPGWFLEANPEGKVPVLKRGSAWLADSDNIVEALEAEYPDAKKLANTPEQASVASGLFGAFARFLKGAGSEEDLLTQLQSLEDALVASGGPYVAGKEFTAVDARLAPALYHLQIALGHFKSWSIPETYSHVLQYMKDVESRQSFKNSAAPPEIVIAGWNRALGVPA